MRFLNRALRAILTLPHACLLYPAHDYRGLSVTSVAEERSYNPRLGGDVSESDFTGYMDNLGLPHPKKMDIAVPANLRCGRPEGEATGAEQAWAPLTYTFAGVTEIHPQTLEEIALPVEIIDVREPDEYASVHIPASKSIPLGAIWARQSEIPRDRAVVVYCSSDLRGEIAAHELIKLGYSNVRYLDGGISAWQNAGLAVVTFAVAVTV